jgi:hypothetical protein
MSEKIKPQHLSRKAIFYVRQSSLYQVMNNLESQKLQYAMEARLRSLGWNEVEIIDEDLGRSAGGCVTCTGLERMVAQVCLGEDRSLYFGLSQDIPMPRDVLEWWWARKVEKRLSPQLVNAKTILRRHASRIWQLSRIPKTKLVRIA